MNELIDELLAERSARPDPEVDDAWRTETQRRIAEIRSGKVIGIPGDEVMAEGRKIVGLSAEAKPEVVAKCDHLVCEIHFPLPITSAASAATPRTR